VLSRIGRTRAVESVHPLPPEDSPPFRHDRWEMRSSGNPRQGNAETHIPQIEYRIPCELSAVGWPSAIDGERNAEEGEDLGLEVREGGAEDLHLLSFPVEAVALGKAEEP
jgi:hypothetical protein